MFLDIPVQAAHEFTYASFKVCIQNEHSIIVGDQHSKITCVVAILLIEIKGWP